MDAQFCEIIRLIGKHTHLDLLGDKRVQELRHPVVRFGLHVPVAAVFVPKRLYAVCYEVITALISRQRPRNKQGHPVTDEVPIRIYPMCGKALSTQGAIHRVSNILKSVKQSSVQVEDYCLTLRVSFFM